MSLVQVIEAPSNRHGHLVDRGCVTRSLLYPKHRIRQPRKSLLLAKNLHGLVDRAFGENTDRKSGRDRRLDAEHTLAGEDDPVRLAGIFQSFDGQITPRA